MNPLRVAMVGLDTSHSVAFPQHIQGPGERLCEEVRVTRCLRFSTPFYSEEGQDERQRQIEAWGVHVSRNFDEVVTDCDAILICINDPAYHLEYFQRCAGLGKPIFLDKPLADTFANGKAIVTCAQEHDTRFFSASSLRFAPELVAACTAMPSPVFASAYGPLGKAPAGSSIIWYGVHAFEMLQRALGRGARTVQTHKVAQGVICVVQYEDSRRGVVELTVNSYAYAGCLRNSEIAVPFAVSMDHVYAAQLSAILLFFQSGMIPVAWEDTLEVMALLDAAERSLQSGIEEQVGS